MDNVQQDPNPTRREQIGWCEYQLCGKEAYYRLEMDCDDMTADVCNKHHDVVLALFNLPDSHND